jgi:hypothetical protein
MTLREELARRLYGVASIIGGEPTESSLSFWRLAADECLRQMEWSRREMHQRCSDYTQNAFDDGGALPGPDRPEGNLPLTIAPPDWKP